MLPTAADGISGPSPCLVAENALPLPHPIVGDSCSGCCVSNSPNEVVPTEPGPSGGQLTVAPIRTEGIPPCSVDGDALPTHHHSSDDAGGGDCYSPNGADLDSQSTLGLPVPPRPDPTNPELLSLAPSISHVEFGGMFLRLLCGLFHLSGVLSWDMLLVFLNEVVGRMLFSFLLLIEEECSEELPSCFCFATADDGGECQADVFIEACKTYSSLMDAIGGNPDGVATAVMLCTGDAHDGAVGNPLNVQLLLFLLPALEPKMVMLVSVLEHSDVVPCRSTV
ncbi:hypothetical protein Nepgr_030091 [Nepenthes gracilis]|uniref:Uncharacterized protein n=1 Tax=Nepenthes gracilis TaxID=150966 RepID=A0AAD3TDV1_NEPGR|nr:hypothetical protein Nepgr_030091 [Nepenthes gracilis]